MNREQAIKKIKKCLRLSASSNPNEAAAAMRQAQALMAKHGLDNTSPELTEVETAEVKVGRQQKNIPKWCGLLAKLISKAFGVRPIFNRCSIWETGRQSVTVRFYGFDGRPEIAAYFYDVLTRQMERDCRAYMKRYRRKKLSEGRKNGFRFGWLSTVHQSINEVRLSGDEASIIESLLANKTKEVAHKKEKKKLDGAAALAGLIAGKKVKLHHGVRGAEPKAIGHD